MKSLLKGTSKNIFYYYLIPCLLHIGEGVNGVFRGALKTMVLVLLLSTVSKAQLSEGGIPPSFSKKTGVKKISEIAVINLPEVNTQKLLQEDAKNNDNKLKPYRFAESIPVDLNLQNAGSWEMLSGSDRLWRLRINSKGAYSLGVNFNKYYLPRGAKVFIYNQNKSHVMGAFTSKNNKENKKLAVAHVKGDEIIIEYYEPAGVNFPGVLSVSAVLHDYKDILKTLKLYGGSGACNVDVNCPEGADWQKEKRAVCKIIFNGYMCSGSMLNNTSKDETPYFLTANHCIDNQTDAGDIVFYFHYENAVCDGGIEPVPLTLSGSTLIATAPDNKLDFCLVKMSETPPDSFNIYYAGWNKKATNPEKGICIHHPAGDVKKISFENDPLVSGDWGSTYNSYSHWQVQEWDLGTTEGGSSGSPIFDQNHQVVGDLTGGDASCSYNYNDLFAKFTRSWEDYSPNEQQLKHWLDPYTTGADTLPGYDPNIPDGAKNAQLLYIINPLDTNINPFNLIPEVVIKNKGSESLTSLTVNYKIDDRDVVSTAWTGNLAFNETDTFALTESAIDEESHAIKAFCSSPNGGLDTNPYNDTLFKAIYIRYDFDAECTNIRAPESHLCNVNTFGPQIQIGNTGIPALTSLIVNYQINSGVIVSKAWAGSMPYSSSEIITFPEITLNNGAYTFKAFVSSPNGKTDSNHLNDTLSLNLDIRSGDVVSLIFQTDSKGEEISCELTNSFSETIFSKDWFPNSVYTFYDVCLENGCYLFTIHDSQGNGLCCTNGQGQYAIYNETSGDTIFNGGVFGSEETTEFCLPMLYVDYSYDKDSVLKGEVVQFSDLSLSSDPITYAWTFEGGTPVISALKNPEVTYNGAGTFDVSLTIYDGTNYLTKLKANAIRVYSSDAVESLNENEKIRVYPNPSYNGLIRVKTNSVNINQCDVYNAIGQLVFSEKKPDSNPVLNLTELKNGIYVLKIYTERGGYVKKIVLL